jgi:HSP90 family molecular chaperone
MQEKGSISIHTENIFPIIKKFLYSDHEIFLRELVSNAVDATQKLKKLASMGEKHHHRERQGLGHDGRGDKKIHQSNCLFRSN